MDEPRPNRSSPSAPNAAPETEASSARDGFWRSRLGLDALRYPIPLDAATIRYSLGAFTAFCFVVLVVTGIWLAQYYNPNPAGAHDSVLYIITRAPFGDIARNLHYWSASAMVVSIVAHIVWVFYSRAYRAPREITWYAGVLLSGLVFLMVVSGTILRYDQEGYEALAHLLAGGELTGALGRFFTAGFTLSTPVLARVFSLHTSLLPLGMVLLIVLHFWLVRTLGISGGSGKTELFSDHLPKVLGMSLILLSFLLALAILRPEGARS
jgi:ubiquinol-cytochrome c reductase cytochrome b subunit